MAFYECKSLTEIMIGSGLTLKKTGPKLLRYSQTIKTVYLPSTLDVVDCHAFKCDQISTIRKSYNICGVESLNIIRFMEFGGFVSKMVKERQSVFGAIFRRLDNGGGLVEMINS